MAKSTGYIKDGVYHRGAKATDRVSPDSSQFKSWDHARQRADHAFDLIQPYKDGKPNPDFVEYHPEQAKNYGFIKGDS